MNHRPRLAIGILSFLGAISPCRSSGCAMGFAQHKVKSTFVVEISYHGQPLQGIETEISRETHQEPYLILVSSVQSDENGRVPIRGLDPGDYFLAVKHAGIGGEAVELKVVGEGEGDASIENTVKLGWPNRKVFKIRRVAGKLVRTPFDFRTGSAEPPLAGAKLTLTDALPGTRRTASVVQTNGKFEFGSLDAGLYIVHIKQDETKGPIGDERIDGDIFVEVSRDATDLELPLLRLYMSDCGMGIRGVDGNEIF